MMPDNTFIANNTFLDMNNNRLAIITKIPLTWQESLHICVRQH